MRISRISLHKWLPILACCAFAGSAAAQVTTATLYGIVTDSTSATVPAAAVILTNEGTAATYRKTTDATGEFGFEFLPVGSYTLRIEGAGFKALETAGIVLSAGQQARQTYQLEVGGVSETVKVEGTAPLLNTVSAEQQQSIDSNTVQELPLARRDFSGLLKLGTGVSTGSGQLRMNGVGEAGTNFSVDGTSASGNTEGRNYSTYGNSGYIQVMSLEGIAEVQTVKGVAPAEYGDALGGQVNLLTKSGTNQWHGSLFENFQAENLNARNQLLATKAPLTFNQFGASSGGALRKDKIFLFGDYEGYQERSSQVVQGTVPTQAIRDQLLAAVPSYNLALSAVPLPNQPVAAGATTGTFLLAKSAQKSDNHIDLKGDVMLGSVSRLSLSYSHGRPYYLTPTIYVNGANDRTYNNVAERGTASYTTGGATWTSETRFGYSISDFGRLDAFFNKLNPGNSTEQFAFGERLPLISTSLGWSTPSSEYYAIEGPTINLSSKVSKQMGKHSLKFGGDYTRICCSRTDPQNPEFHYNTLAQLLSNTPTTITANFGNGLYTANLYHFGFFAQDEYRIRPDLVLDFGVRNDYYSNLVVHAKGVKGAGTGFYNPDGLLDSQFHVGPLRPQSSPYEPDPMNLAPRFGFSYSPGSKGKTVIRGGFGILFSSQVPGAMWQSVQSGSDVPFRSAFTQQDVLSYGLQFPLYTDDLRKVVQTKQAASGILSVFSVFNPQLQNPYTMQYSLGFQREITPTLVLESGFVGTRGVKFLAQRPMDLPDRLTGLRPNPLLSVTYYIDNSQQMVFSSWQTTLTKRYSHKLSGSVHYTWGKSLSPQGGDNGAYYQGDAATKTQDFFNYRADRGPSAGDVTHYFASQWLYELPTLDQWRFLRPALGGWQLSGIVAAQTGSAFTVTQSSSLPSSRPDYIGGDAVLTDYRTTLRYLNTADFARVPVIAASGATVRPGNIGNGAIRGPGLWNVDFSLAKNFKITEGIQFQIRSDMFNALNHTNLTGLVTEITNPRFGQLTSTNGARTIQLNARLSW
ncbi:MAG TPA: carboxypeptidase regulatory-like domain-containing protein [Bryobacteraceae bacterium]|nr:carboxypeptidase regulatory-like domain-containing protein [Bryobacteraceae bacterium]